MFWLLAILVVQQLFLLVALAPGASPSRRLLAAALVLVVPVAGPYLAIVVRRAHGVGVVGDLDPLEAPRRSMSADDVRRTGSRAPLIDRLMSLDTAERNSALVELVEAADAEAIALLRWAVEHGTREAVLEAALTLEELDLRRERRLEAAARALDDEASFDHALAAGDAASAGVINGLADIASVPVLIEQARSYYTLALELDASRVFEVIESLARLELAARQPVEALELVDWLMVSVPPEVAHRLQRLRDEVAFAARRWDLLSPAGAQAMLP